MDDFRYFLVMFWEFLLWLVMRGIWDYQLWLAGTKECCLIKYVRNRVWKKINDWKEKLLSQAGKEILPKSLCRALSSICAKFWWEKKASKRGIH